ncbi:MAG: hypothetical protein J7L69_08380, partial [Desulfobulbaceae bacterium]|nr:hypothetical protein [Desulfobulbaceae bacterium]
KESESREESRAETLRGELSELRNTVKEMRQEGLQVKQLLVERDSQRAALAAERDKTHKIEQELGAASAKIDELNASSHHWWTEADKLTCELHDVYHCKSWKLTLPLRKLKRLLKLMIYIPKWIFKLPKRSIYWLLRKQVEYIRRHPGFKGKIVYFLYKHPGLDARLRRMARQAGIGPALTTEVIHNNFESKHDDESADLSNMTPQARRIYRDLKAAIDQKNSRR